MTVTFIQWSFQDASTWLPSSTQPLTALPSRTLLFLGCRGLTLSCFFSFRAASFQSPLLVSSSDLFPIYSRSLGRSPCLRLKSSICWVCICFSRCIFSLSTWLTYPTACLTSPLGYLRGSLNSIRLKPNSWFALSLPAPRPAFFLLSYFNKWQLTIFTQSP